MVTIFLSDLDGTLLNSSGKVSDISAEMLNMAVNDGKLFSVATARSYDTAATLLKAVNVNAPAVLLNGALICDLKSGEIYNYSALDSAVAERIFSIFREQGREPFCYFLKNNSSAKSVTLEYISPATRFDIEFIKECETIGSSIEKVSKFNFENQALYFTAMDTENIIMPICRRIKELPNCEYTIYSDTYHEGYYFLDIFAGCTSKSKGVITAKEISGAQKLIAFGDNINDISMLDAADWAVAVSNAVSEAKEICDEIIGSNSEDAVAKYIYHFIA